MSACVENFLLYNDKGQSTLYVELGSWKGPRGEFIFGPAVGCTWTVDGNQYEILLSEQSWNLLPDATGFICFEKEWKPDNCVLRDAYGKERMRLTVPWNLTKPKNPDSAKQPTSFASISSPYVNPVDGRQGLFGVTAWVEHAGKYYFELDYHTGQFLWGREIRD